MYILCKFRFLKKLLLVHGHWSYARNGVMYAAYTLIVMNGPLMSSYKDSQLFLQEHRSHWSTLVVPDF